MKKILIAVLVLTIGSWLWCDLHTYYKKGAIVLKQVEDFGKGNDWEALFYNLDMDMVIAPDGSIFISNTRLNNVYKFNQLGKVLKKFGKKGNGPGEFLLPDNLSIQDNKYLVVGESSTNKRFSLWDFNGNFIKSVRTNTGVFYLTALRNHRVAYYFISQKAEEKNGFNTIYSIVIKDTDSGKEKVLEKITLLDRSSIKTGESTRASLGNFFGEVYLSQTIEGNLAVGVSNRPEIKIYSPEGNMLNSFALKVEPVAVTKKYLKDFARNYMAKFKQRGEKQMKESEESDYELEKKTLKKFDFSTIFDTNLPLYKEISMDSEGNFLVFKYTECQKDCNPIFQVYSKTGEFVCETQLILGKYELEIDPGFRKIRFANAGIFGLLIEKGDKDEIIKLVKSNYE